MTATAIDKRNLYRTARIVRATQDATAGAFVRVSYVGANPERYMCDHLGDYVGIIAADNLTDFGL